MKTSSPPLPSGAVDLSQLAGAPPRWKTPRLYEATDGPRVRAFIETLCPTLKGPGAGQLVRLRPWQSDTLDDLYEVRPDGKRRNRLGLIGVARKNGKSLIGSGLALYGLMGDGEMGAEVYSCAGDKDQARIVFNEARKMVEKGPLAEEVGKTIFLYRDAIEFRPTGSVYRVLSAEAYTKEGLNPSLVIFDEVHVQPDWDLWAVMTQGSATREKPLVLGITTAGWDRESLCYWLYEHGKKIINGEVDDPYFFLRWWEPSNPNADHTTPETWAEGNPGLGDFQYVEDFIASVGSTPENKFRRYRCNQWTASMDAWLPFGKWDEREAPELYKRRFIVGPDGGVQQQDGTPVVLGFDGAWSGDSTALVGCTVPTDEHPKPFLFLVRAWEKPRGAEEWRIPIAEVEQTIRDACEAMNVREVAADPFKWEKSLQDLADEGLPIVEFRTNAVDRMVPACQSFEDAVLDGALCHDGNPTLARHLTNAQVKSDHRGSRIVKEHKASTRYIDAAVAAVIAHHRAVLHKPQADPAFYAMEDFQDDW